jgi:transglutaminase/protease-like cytokinesis protein 3
LLDEYTAGDRDIEIFVNSVSEGVFQEAACAVLSTDIIVSTGDNIMAKRTAGNAGKPAIVEVRILASTVPVTSVSVSPTSAGLSVSATQQLTAIVSPSNATNKNASWSSNNSSFASVDSSGLVTGIAAGSATITVTTVDGSYTATCNVTVNVSTNINPISASIKEGLKVFPNPSNGFIKIMIPSEYSTCEVNIYNFMGAVIYNNILMNSEMNTINLSDQVSGVYFIKVNAGNSKFYKKFILNNPDVR